jgi:ribose transport system permease protein
VSAGPFALSLPRGARGLTSRTPAVLAWLAAAGLFAFASASIDGFFSLSAIRSTLVLCSILGIAAAGQTVVVVLGGIDLSIPALMTLTSVVCTELPWSTPWLLLLAATLCVAVGAAQGFLARLFRVHPLIVTLGGGFMVAGALLAWTQGSAQGSPPQWMTRAASAAVSMGPIPLPPVVAVWAVVAVVTVVLMARTPFGRQIYAFGASPSAAEYALVRPKALWAGVFALSGLMSFVAGVMLSGFTGYGDLHSGDSYLFDSVAAVIIGGTSLLGGRGGYMRTIAGTITLVLAEIVLVGYGVKPSLQEAALGAIILGFVALYGRDRHVRNRV